MFKQTRVQQHVERVGGGRRGRTPTDDKPAGDGGDGGQQQGKVPGRRRDQLQEDEDNQQGENLQPIRHHFQEQRLL